MSQGHAVENAAYFELYFSKHYETQNIKFALQYPEISSVEREIRTSEIATTVKLNVRIREMLSSGNVLISPVNVESSVSVFSTSWHQR